jgi:hypothetical protein
MKAMRETEAAPSSQPIGCGKPQPIFLYWPELRRHLEIATSTDDLCGDRFTPGGIGEPSFLLCESCGVKLGLIW